MCGTENDIQREKGGLGHHECCLEGMMIVWAQGTRDETHSCWVKESGEGTYLDSIRKRKTSPPSDRDEFIRGLVFKESSKPPEEKEADEAS